MCKQILSRKSIRLAFIKLNCILKLSNALNSPAAMCSRQSQGTSAIFTVWRLWFFGSLKSSSRFEICDTTALQFSSNRAQFDTIEQLKRRKVFFFCKSYGLKATAIKFIIAFLTNCRWWKLESFDEDFWESFFTWGINLNWREFNLFTFLKGVCKNVLKIGAIFQN